MLFTLQYTSICIIQLFSFSAFNSPSYIGKSNLTSNLIKDVFFFLFLGLSGGVDRGTSFPFPLPSECPSIRYSSIPLSCLEVEESSL